MTKDTLVDVCNTRAEAEYVVAQLRGADFDMGKLSIVGTNPHDARQVLGYYDTGEGMKHWGTPGTFWNGVWRTLSASALFVIPGIGPILAGGPLVAAVVGALERTVAVGGLNALGVALYDLGVPQNAIRTYENALKQDRFLIIAHGSTEELAKARGILGQTVAS